MNVVPTMLQVLEQNNQVIAEVIAAKSGARVHLPVRDEEGRIIEAHDLPVIKKNASEFAIGRSCPLP
jgi:hypothetical protein